MGAVGASGLKTRIEALLYRSIVPFWGTADVSAEHGCHIEFDHSAQPLPAANRTLGSQAGMLLYFSLLARHTGDRGALAKAALLFDFISDRLGDREYGGYFWDTESAAEGGGRQGQRSWCWAKHLYAQAFALWSIAEFARTSGLPAARRAADDLFDLILTAGKPDSDGIFVECLLRDFSRSPPDCWSPIGRFGPEAPTHGVHIHILKAFDTYRVLAADDRSTEWTIRMVEALEAQAFADVGNRKCRFADAFDREGRRKVSVGHVLEEIWFSFAAERGLARVPDVARYVADYGRLDPGHDHRRGGFFHSFAADGTRDRFGIRKLWWVQAEAIVCSLYLAALADDARALDRLIGTLGWVERRHVDRKHGEWHEQPRRPFARQTAKGGIWKTADHPGRALIECIALLDEVGREVATPQPPP